MDQYNNINQKEPEESESDQDNDQELEKDFFSTNKKAGRFIVICGKTGSGKSWLVTNYIAIS